MTAASARAEYLEIATARRAICAKDVHALLGPTSIKTGISIADLMPPQGWSANAQYFQKRASITVPYSERENELQAASGLPLSSENGFSRIIRQTLKDKS